MHRARRDLVLQTPFRTGQTTGTFALRSPVRPNPIASSIVELVAIDGTSLQVRGLDCLDGTPLIDLKPERSVQRLIYVTCGFTSHMKRSIESRSWSRSRLPWKLIWNASRPAASR